MALTVSATDRRTVSVLDDLLDRKSVSMEQASEVSGVSIGDLRKLRDGDATSIRLSTLAALCSGLHCTPEDILRVQDLLQPKPALRALLARVATCQSRALSTASLFASAVIGVWFLLGVVSQVNPVDFYVYHYAASQAWAGGNIYVGNIHGPDMAPGGLPFTYTPFAALVLAPLSLLPAPVAYLLWSVSSALLMAALLRRLLPPKHRHNPFIVGTVALASSGSIIMASHIIFGQINVFLMTLVLLDLCRQRQGSFLRNIPPGVLVGLAAAIKLTPALFIVYFIVSRQKRAACGSSLTAVGATLLAFLIYPDMSWDFLTHVLWNLSERVSLDGFFATSGNNSIHGALAAVGEWTSFPALLLALCVAALGLYAAAGIYRRGEATQAAIVVGLTACLVSPVSWMHHWVYLLPALVILWRRGGPKTRAFCYSSGAILIATGPNLGDVLLNLEQPLLLPLAVCLRESLLFSATVSAVLLYKGQTRGEPNARPARTEQTA